LQQEDRQQEHHHDEEQDIEDVNFLFLSGWAAIIIILLLGIFIESMGTGLIVKFFNLFFCQRF